MLGFIVSSYFTRVKAIFVDSPGRITDTILLIGTGLIKTWCKIVRSYFCLTGGPGGQPKDALKAQRKRMARAVISIFLPITKLLLSNETPLKYSLFT